MVFVVECREVAHVRAQAGYCVADFGGERGGREDGEGAGLEADCFFCCVCV